MPVSTIVALNPTVTTPVPDSPTVIGIVGTGTGTAGTGDLAAYDTAQVVTTVDEATAAFGAGTILDAVREIYTHAAVHIVGVRFNDSGTAANPGAARRTAVNAGLDGLAASASGAFPPTLLIAPGETYNEPDDSDACTVAAKLLAVAESIGAYAILDAAYAPSSAPARTAFEVVSLWADNNGGDDGTAVSTPVVTPSKAAAIPGSSYLAGVIARNDQRYGEQESVANRTLEHLSSVTFEAGFNPRLATSQAIVLEDKGVTSIVRHGGRFIAWGGKGKVGVATDVLRFMGARRMLDKIERGIFSDAAGFVARGVTGDLPDQVAAVTSRRLRGYVESNPPQLASATVSPDAVYNTRERLQNGQVGLIVDVEFISAAEQFRYSIQYPS